MPWVLREALDIAVPVGICVGATLAAGKLLHTGPTWPATGVGIAAAIAYLVGVVIVARLSAMRRRRLSSARTFGKGGDRG